MGAPLAAVAGMLAVEGSGWTRKVANWVRGARFGLCVGGRTIWIGGHFACRLRERQEAGMTWCCSVPQCPHPYRGVTMSHVMQKTPATVSGFNRCQCCTGHRPPPEMQSPCPREVSPVSSVRPFAILVGRCLGLGWGRSSRSGPGGLCLYHSWEPVSLWLWVFSINSCNPF